MFQVRLRRSSRSPPPETPGAGAALAERLERFCATAISYRASGACAEPGLTQARHRSLGHDTGCRALGVPRRSIQITLQLWDTVGVAALLMEAIDEAIEALQDGGAVWSEELARECVAYAIRRRITPEPKPAGSPEPDSELSGR
ncbi:hypothetical protein ACXR2W_02960 [Leucobacter sp. HY1908]